MPDAPTLTAAQTEAVQAWYWTAPKGRDGIGSLTELVAGWLRRGARRGLG